MGVEYIMLKIYNFMSQSQWQSLSWIGPVQSGKFSAIRKTQKNHKNTVQNRKQKKNHEKQCFCISKQNKKIFVFGIF